MNKIIPLYSLKNLTGKDGTIADVFFLNGHSEKSSLRINIPFRRNFYAIGICLNGRAELKANLETYIIEPKSLVTKPPHTINQWTYMSDDFETLTIFFSLEFISNKGSQHFHKFGFFEPTARHVFASSKSQSEDIIASFRLLQQKYNTDNAYRNDVLRNQIIGLLYEIAGIYDQQTITSTAVQTRSQSLSSDFKKLLNIHFTAERSLAFYADKLFITPKHLTESVKEATGKTAGDWIEDAVILEAKVLLQNPGLSVSQIADLLQFSNQSAFGRFFKNRTGQTPAAYRKSF